MQHNRIGGHRRLFALIAAALAVILATTLAVGLASVRLYEQAIAEHGTTRTLATAGQAVDALLWHDHAAQAQRLAAGFARTMQSLPADDAAFADRLEQLLQQEGAGNGARSVLGAAIHRADGTPVLQHVPPGAPQTLPDSPPDSLINAIGGRAPGARLLPLLHGWQGETGPLVSVVVPVNGRASPGYLALHFDPVMALHALDRYLDMPVRLLDGTGRPLTFLGDSTPDADAAQAGTRLDVAAPDGSTLMQVELFDDRRALQAATSSARRTALALVVGAVGALSLIVLAIVWRHLASSAARERLMAANRAKARSEQTRRDADAALAAKRCAAEAAQLATDQGRALQLLSDGLTRLARGDLSTRIESSAHDPFPKAHEALMQAYNDALRTFEAALCEIREVAQGVETGADEISSAAGDLATRAETQAATLEQSAAALNELTSSVHATATLAKSGAGESLSNRDAARNGAEIVEQAVEAMEAIEQGSARIAMIIGVIDDIAFQTNLLALNAGVEAARAGEAGRGFAVVASEVRALAQRAATSAKEIKSLIAASTGQVETGAALVRQAGASLQEILERAQQTADSIGEIASAAREQAAGIDEINTGVNQLDQVTQQNAAAAAEVTGAASGLMRKAGELTATISTFRLRAANDLPPSQPIAAQILPFASASAPLAKATGAGDDGIARDPRAAPFRPAEVHTDAWSAF